MRKFKLSFFFLSLTLLSGVIRGDIIIDFDTNANWTAGSGSLASYQTNHVYAESGMTFTGGPALRNTTATQDGFPGAFGTYSWRLRDGTSVDWTATYTTVSPSDSKVTGFSFSVRRWDGTPSPNTTVSYSFDGGTNFTVAGTINNTFLSNSSNWTTFSVSFAPTTVSNGDFVVRLSQPATPAAERIMVDNFRLSAIPEPSAAVGLLLGMLLLPRRKRR